MSTPLPDRMKNLPVDERGYAVPWFVAKIDGKWEFRAMDQTKWMHAVRFKVCWVCGVRLGRWMTFVAGPMCGINRTTSEPPCHYDCAKWSAINCPFLSNPEAIRRVDEKVPLHNENTPGFSLPRNPGVTMLWTTDTYTVFRDMKDKPLLSMGEPTKVEWYARGREATREEVMTSISGGLPVLEALAMQQKDGLEYLKKCQERFDKYLPQEVVTG